MRAESPQPDGQDRSRDFPFNPANASLRDMNAREVVIALSLVVFFFLIGLFPNLFFDKINPATAELVELVNQTTLLAGR